jgi:hypothetical protein
MDYVDVVFAHRHDATVPMEEIVRAFTKTINDGKAHYWYCPASARPNPSVFIVTAKTDYSFCAPNPQEYF